MSAPGEHALARRAGRLLRSPDLARAWTLAALAAVLSSFAVERMSGAVTAGTVVVGLDVLGVAILVARRRELSLLRVAPTSLLAFLAWALVSAAWAEDTAGAIGAWLGLAGYGILAIVLAHVRDTLQTVRALGDVLRVVLAASLGVEILAGVLLDMPFPFLGVLGDLAQGGPVQGLFGSRNMLGLVAVVALVTFVVEWRTQSVTTQTAAFSVALAGALAVLSASPTAAVVAVAVTVAMLALRVVRAAAPGRRGALQGLFATLVVLGLGAAYALRHGILRWLDATAGFSLRADLWNLLLDLVAQRPVQGFGWQGRWDPGVYPVTSVNALLGQTHGSALNAYLDVLFQLGGVGLILFVLLTGVAFVRSWRVASERRSVVYAWTPLLLVALLVNSAFESFTIDGVGWTLLVLAAVRAGQAASWRERLDLAASGGQSQDPLPPAR